MRLNKISQRESEIYKNLLDCISRNNNGGVTYKNLTLFDMLLSALASQFLARRAERSAIDLLPRNIIGIVSGTVKSHCKSGIEDYSVFCNEIHKKINHYVSSKTSKYTMASWITLQSSASFRRIWYLKGIRITLSGGRIKKFQKSKLQLTDGSELELRAPLNATYIYAQGLFANEIDAGIKLSEVINLFCALMDLMFSRSRVFFAGKERSQSQIQLSEYLFLFDRKNNVLSDPNWYNESVPHHLFGGIDRFQDFDRIMDIMVKNFNRSPFISELERSLLSCREALLAVSDDRRLLNAWIGFEVLLHSGEKGDKSEDVVKRLSRLFNDNRAYEYAFSHANELRDQIVHGKKVVGNMHQLSYALTFFLVSFIRSILKSKISNSDRSRLLMSLDLPEDANQIIKMIRERKEQLKVFETIWKQRDGGKRRE